ncbi:GNAT family N-acetyltransferase [Armatimonas rosea]|uniref:Ribosomal protein S18 acetylase RimI-like enzyme n=1 Tax=Armatimonas rosea TaxID=685828 RepID=A0A7W9W8Q7_ARMRO|nr:GNAT family N-acetyltransferase [Armatimonas rosea]MBB6052998.1 ribosomal protein S18 acetylase RimI-like enzyme [Armatimonas rosea]
MATILLRRLQPSEWQWEAQLIAYSTNAWYQASGKPAIFSGDPTHCQIFCQVYEALDPGCCIVAEDTEIGALVGSCFYHPRPSHISVGIVNTHPGYFGHGIARQMLDEVLQLAEEQGKPLRLVSSAMNLDSFSLYTRSGFVPRLLFQDMLLPDTSRLPAPDPRVRPITPADVPALVALEQELVGIDRSKDFAYFTENTLGIWSGSLWEEAGKVEGFLFAVAHPASNMLGPGVARNDTVAAALLAQERLKHPGNPVFLVPASAEGLIQTLYRWGARNCELHVAQVRGAWQEPKGIVFPSFLPESG